MSRNSKQGRRWGETQGEVMLGALADDPGTVANGIFILTQANARAKQLADAAVASATLLTRSTVKEWADGFKAQVEGMVVRLITVDKNGIYPWQKTPKLIKDVADFIESEAAQMSSNKAELLSVSGNLKQFAAALATPATAAVTALVAGIVQGAREGFPPQQTWVVPVVGAAVALVAAAYVWRAFR